MFNAYILKKGFGQDMSIANCVWCGKEHRRLEIRKMGLPVDILHSIKPIKFEKFDYAIVCPETKRKIYIRYR